MLHRADNEQATNLKSSERPHSVKNSKVEIFCEQKKQQQKLSEMIVTGVHMRVDGVHAEVQHGGQPEIPSKGSHWRVQVFSL